MARSRDYTREEERANAISHGLGIILGLTAGYILLHKAVDNKSIWAVISIIIYLFGMLSSYVTSTWYHACTHEKKKAVLRKFDHAAIYLHIAGTFAPFLLIILWEKGGWG